MKKVTIRPRCAIKFILELHSHIGRQALTTKSIGPIWLFNANMTEAYHRYIITSNYVSYFQPEVNITLFLFKLQKIVQSLVAKSKISSIPLASLVANAGFCVSYRKDSMYVAHSMEDRRTRISCVN